MSIRRLKSCITALAAAALMAAASTPAGATMIDAFSLTVSEDLGNYGVYSPALQNSLKLVAQDRPMFSIENASTSGATITSVTVTMTNTTFDFGSLIFVPQSTPITVTHYSPGATPALHAGAADVNLVFDNFTSGLTYDFRTDIDRAADHGLTLTNYRQALASGSDQSQWALINVGFSDGQTISERITPSMISGAPQNPVYSYFYCMLSVPPVGQIDVSGQVDVPPTPPTPPVPEPGTWVLAALAGVGLPLLLNRRRRPSRG